MTRLTIAALACLIGLSGTALAAGGAVVAGGGGYAAGKKSKVKKSDSTSAFGIMH